MTPVGFEPTIPASERPQTRALDRAALWDRHRELIPVNLYIQRHINTGCSQNAEFFSCFDPLIFLYERCMEIYRSA